MYGEFRGEEVRGFLSSSDLTTPAEILLRLCTYNASDATPQRVLVAGERLVITDIVISNGATVSTVTIFQDVDGGGTLTTGEELIAATLAANTPVHVGPLGTPIICRRVEPAAVDQTGAVAGNIFVVASAASANTRIFISGRIVKV